MELIGISACAGAHDLHTQTSQFFLLIIHASSGPIDKSACILCDPGIFLFEKQSRLRPQAHANFDRKLHIELFSKSCEYFLKSLKCDNI